ncbi:hypothetical protein ACFE04_000290 [Oxalis oulophora]
MAFSLKIMSIFVASLGVISFVLGVIAENNKPASGTPIVGKDVVICKYPSDPTVFLGYLATGFLMASTFVGYSSLFYPYKGKEVPKSAMFQNTTFSVFFNIAWLTGGFAAALLLWPTITEQLHLTHNIHYDLKTTCPTAKTGVLGGGAFLSLDSALLWLVTLMLANNAREDYFAENKVESMELTTAA